MATDQKERLRADWEELVRAISDRTVGAADRRVSQLTEKLGDLSKNGGIPTPHPHVPTPHLPKPDLSRLPKPSLPKPDLSRLPKPSLPKPDLSRLPKPSLPHVSLPGRGDRPETKVTTIIEEIDVGVPVSLAYDLWTEFAAFPTFMKKVEVVDALEDQRLRWKAKIWWSHRTWEATILEQQPEERIVWRSEGDKGHVDGAVTFHDLTPDLTRIIVVLEYHPQGLFEHTANLWRAQGRRVRAELQHFRRHAMAHALLDPDGVDGWRGVIEDGEVVAPPEESEDAAEAADETEEPEDAAEAADEDEYDEQDEYADDDATEAVDREYDDDSAPEEDRS